MEDQWDSSVGRRSLLPRVTSWVQSSDSQWKENWLPQVVLWPSHAHCGMCIPPIFYNNLRKYLPAFLLIANFCSLWLELVELTGTLCCKTVWVHSFCTKGNPDLPLLPLFSFPSPPVSLSHRGSSSVWKGPSHPLPGRRVPLCHHRHRLLDEAHADDHDWRLQVRQRQTTNYLPEPQLHGAVAGIWGRPKQWRDPTDPDTKAHGHGDGCVTADRTERALALWDAGQEWRGWGWLWFFFFVFCFSSLFFFSFFLSWGNVCERQQTCLKTIFNKCEETRTSDAIESHFSSSVFARRLKRSFF